MPLVVLFLIVPIFQSPTFQTSWEAKWFSVWLGIAAVCLVWLIHWPNLGHLPKLSGTELLLLFGIVCVDIFSFAFNFPNTHWVGIFQQIGFIVLTVYLYDLLRRDQNRGQKWLYVLSFLALLITIVQCLEQLWQCPQFGLGPIVCATGSFRNENMLSEALAIQWCLIFPFIGRSHQTQKLLFFGLGLLSLTIVVLNNSRAIMLSLGILGGLWVLKNRSWKTHIWLFIFGGMGFLFIKQDFHDRAVLMFNTFKLIFDYPFGVGAGNFAFSLLPYQLASKIVEETEITSSAHNMILTLAAEKGVAYSCLVLMLCCLFLRKAFEKEISTQMLAMCSLFFMLCLFQFPNQSPYPFVGLAAMLAHLLQNRRPVQRIYSGPLGQLTIFGVSILMIVACGTHYHLHGRTNRPSYITKLDSNMCKFSQDFWQRCLAVSWRFRIDGDSESSNKSLIEGLKNQPANYLLYKEYLINQLQKFQVTPDSNSEHESLKYFIRNYNSIFTLKTRATSPEDIKRQARAWAIYQSHVQYLVSQ